MKLIHVTIDLKKGKKVGVGKGDLHVNSEMATAQMTMAINLNYH